MSPFSLNASHGFRKLKVVLLLLHTLSLSLPASAAPVDPASLLGFSPSNTVLDENTDPVHGFAATQTDSPNPGAALNFTGVNNPQPIRGSKGGTQAASFSAAYQALNPDVLAPPTTDHGDVQNAAWPMDLSPVKLGLNRAGWSRQENTENLPGASDMAGVQMRLEPGAYRELHWHIANEWALVLNGSVRVPVVDSNGESFVDDLNAGDVWFFPSSIPHSIQALDGGVEFLLVFDDGDFSEDNTFLASELFATQPLEVLAQNFHSPISAFKNIPPGQLFIFPGTPAPKNISEQNVTDPAGHESGNNSYTFHFSELPNTHEIEGGSSVKIIDPTIFPIASMFSAALVTIAPGAMREIHWHADDEWNFFLSGSARITVYAAQGNARTLDYGPGSVGYIQKDATHYIQNTGTEPCIVLEVLQAPRFTDVSVSQWLALTPHQVVQDTLSLSAETVDAFPTEEQYIVPAVAT
jgi:oxalate decarboxylase family bicupin protein